MDVNTVLRPRKGSLSNKKSIVPEISLTKIFKKEDQSVHEKLIKNSFKERFSKITKIESEINSSSSDLSLTKRITPVDEKIHKIPRVKGIFCISPDNLIKQPEKIDVKFTEKQINNFTFDANSRIKSETRISSDENKILRTFTPELTEAVSKPSKVAIPYVPLIHNYYGETFNKEKNATYTGILSFLDDFEKLGLDEIPIKPMKPRTKKFNSSTPVCTSTADTGPNSPYIKKPKTKNISVDRTRAFRFVPCSPSQSPIYNSKKEIVAKKVAPVKVYDEKSAAVTMPSTPIQQSANPIFLSKRGYEFKD
ncbi:unnamed protein product [Blepharisma stoltei]|uniref:Uncharacterized protein n=1 Tax=Blepharisma stoltei TaxID=1481888 RepID=A0AAU9J9S9_9CILI|nr:unnamed protein product [Blepharisma stoltei]